MAVATRSQTVIDLREPRVRIPALDAARGLAIVVMLVAVHPGPRGALLSQLKHPAWHGLTFADLFFPLFLFAIGGAMGFSRRAASFPSVLRRAAILFALGVALQWIRHGAPMLPGVLQHIAMAYVAAWAILRTRPRTQVLLCAAAVVGYAAAFFVFADGADPWSRDGGFAHVVNGWVYGGFRTEGVPQSLFSAVNVVIGAWAVRRGRPDVRRLGLWAGGLVAAGVLLAPVVPVNKHLWTSSFALLSAGASVAMFVGLHLLGEWRRGAIRPLEHLGTNAIAVYVVFIGIGGAIARFRGPLDDAVAGVPDVVVAHAWALTWLVLGWLFARALHRRRIFFKV